MYYEKN